MDKVYPNAGHRGRLKQRFLANGLDGFLDYEIVELLLTLGTPRRDCKPVAKAIVEKYNGLTGSLDATADSLKQIHGVGENNIIAILLFKALSERYAKSVIKSKISLNNPSDVAKYLNEKIGKDTKENFILLMLDSHKHLIEVSEISKGSIDTSIVHPREVFEIAIKKLAGSIILAHNHPSGSTEPSKEDLQVTQRLSAVGDLVGIPVIDHIIVTSTEYLSFKEKGLL